MMMVSGTDNELNVIAGLYARFKLSENEEWMNEVILTIITDYARDSLLAQGFSFEQAKRLTAERVVNTETIRAMGGRIC